MEQTLGLVVVDENGRRSDPHPLGPATLVGFDPSVDVRVEDPAVGDRHLLLTRLEDGTLELVDMGAGGTKLNGHAMEVGTRLRVGAGDMIELGRTTLELVRVGGGGGSAAESGEREPKLPPEWGVDWGEDPRRRGGRRERDYNTVWLLPALFGVGMLYLALTYGIPAVINQVTKPLEMAFPEERPRPTATPTPKPTPTDEQRKTYDPMYVPPRPEEPAPPPPEEPSPEEPSSPGPASPAPAWIGALFGRPPTPGEAEAAARRTGEGLVAWVLTQRVLYERWLDQERGALGLTGVFQPRERSRLVEGLRDGSITPRGALEALAGDKAFAQRHLGAAAFADAVLRRLLGVDPAKHDAARQAIQEVYEGRAAQVFGQQVKAPRRVIALALADPRARAAVVRRAWVRLHPKPPGADQLDAAVSQVERRPHDLFRLMVEWARAAR